MKLHDTLHYGQLPTTRRAIREQLTEFNRCMPAMIIQCILHENDDSYHIYLGRAADHLEMLSRFVYFDKDKKSKKLPVALYKMELFEGMAETPDEVASRAHDVHETLTDAIDYVIKHHDGLPKPEMDRIGLFPQNYKDYHYDTFSVTPTGSVRLIESKNMMFLHHYAFGCTGKYLA